MFEVVKTLTFSSTRATRSAVIKFTLLELFDEGNPTVIFFLRYLKSAKSYIKSLIFGISTTLDTDTAFSISTFDDIQKQKKSIEN